MAKLIRRCLHRCHVFAVRFGILLLAMLAISVVGIWSGELITLPMAIARITEALGAAAADSFVE